MVLWFAAVQPAPTAQFLTPPHETRKKHFCPVLAGAFQGELRHTRFLCPGFCFSISEVLWDICFRIILKHFSSFFNLVNLNWCVDSVEFQSQCLQTKVALTNRWRVEWNLAVQSMSEASWQMMGWPVINPGKSHHSAVCFLHFTVASPWCSFRVNWWWKEDGRPLNSPGLSSR